MTKKRPTPFEKAAIQFHCQTCGSIPRVWCTTVSHGDWTPHLHGPRHNAAWRILEPVVIEYEEQLAVMRDRVQAWQNEAERLRKVAS